jgi:aromatic-L-amino-acid decarboxylase
VTGPLRLDADQRRDALLASIDALERLAEARAAAGIHAPADEPLLDEAREAPPEHPSDLHEVLERYVRFASAGWDKSADGNLAYIPSGSLDAGVIAALLAAGAHAFTGTSFEAPAMVAMEEGVLRWMADALGLPASAGGVLLSGGSLANQTAIVTARARARAQAGPLGVGGRESDGEETLIVSERVHHSVTKAAALAGIPAVAIRRVAVDPAGRMRTDALEELVEADLVAGRRPFLIVGIAGTTDTGSIDPLERLADVAAQVGAWFHVDAAYGGFFALTERGRRRLRGIERADSVTVDAHKGLFLPYGLGALLARDPADLVRAHEASGAYLRAIPTLEGLPHYFQRSPELTRPNRAPLAWFPLQLHGSAAFAAELDRMLDLAELAHRRLAGTPGVSVGPPPELSIVTFRAAAGDAVTDALVAALHATGRFQVSTTTLDGLATVRFAFLSPRTSEARVHEALDLVAEVAGRA